jgi:hypothetical protein
MTLSISKTRLLVLCLSLSILIHILIGYALRIFGTYDFTTPIAQPQSVEVDLAKLVDAVSRTVPPVEQEQEESGLGSEDAPKAETQNPPPLIKEPLQPEPEPPIASVNISNEAPRVEKLTTPVQKSEAIGTTSPDEKQRPAATSQNSSSLNSISPLLSTNDEKLTYQISVFGLPVGSAELEAKQVKGDIRLTLRVKSNTVISTVYPVDDLVETSHIGGNFIITKIRQREGTFKSDTAFTIFLREKSVFWIDRITNKSLRETIPTDEALDTLSGIYFLRNRQLQVGKTETLHIYDSESYADVPVEILRRESLRLPNLTTVDTLVVKPFQKSAGIFRRTGDILIWMTDDANKVPVKIVTSVAIGTVTVELISAESKPPEKKL